MTDVPSQGAPPGTRLPFALDVRAPQGPAFLAAKQVIPPTAARVAGQGVFDVAGTAIDVTFGTHWAILEYWEGNKALKRLRQDEKDVRTWSRALPSLQGISSTTRTEIAKNARAQLLFSRYDRYAQHVKRDVQGVGVGTGGLVFGTGMALSSNIFGSFSAAVAATSTPIALFAGTPVLSGAAVMLGAYEGLRAWRMHRLRPHIKKIPDKPVVGNEHRVYAIVDRRLKQASRHSKARSLAMFTLAAAPPLLVIGTGPGLAVGVPGVIAGLAASYYKHTRLLYQPPLHATACLALGGRRDIGNRIDLADREYETLKKLKEEKRAFHPRGSNGIPVARDLFAAWGAVRRWWTPPRHVAPPHHTVMRFLRAQAGHEVTYLRQQQAVFAYETDKAQKNPDAEDRALRLDEMDQRNLYTALRASLVNRHMAGNEHDVIPSASEVCTQFMRFVETHRLDPLLLGALQSDKMYKIFTERDLLLHQDKKIGLKKDTLQAMVDAPTATDFDFVHELSAFYERFLFNHEKKLATAMRNQLSELLLLRMYADATSPKTTFKRVTPPATPALPQSETPETPETATEPTAETAHSP